MRTRAERPVPDDPSNPKSKFPLAPAEASASTDSLAATSVNSQASGSAARSRSSARSHPGTRLRHRARASATPPHSNAAARMPSQRATTDTPFSAAALPPRLPPVPPLSVSAPGGGAPCGPATPKEKSPATVWPSSPSATQCTR